MDLPEILPVIHDDDDNDYDDVFDNESDYVEDKDGTYLNLFNSKMSVDEFNKQHIKGIYIIYIQITKCIYKYIFRFL